MSRDCTMVRTYWPDENGVVKHDGYFLLDPETGASLKWISLKHFNTLVKAGEQR